LKKNCILGVTMPKQPDLLGDVQKEFNKQRKKKGVGYAIVKQPVRGGKRVHEVVPVKKSSKKRTYGNPWAD
jgi:hypothetical protein